LPFFSQSIKEYKIAAEKYEALLKKRLLTSITTAARSCYSKKLL